MPYTTTGLWIPYEIPPKRSWKSGFSLPVVVSIISVFITVTSLWITRYNTQVAQRAYLATAFKLLYVGDTLKLLENDIWKSVIVNYEIEITNDGSTPAINVYAKNIKPWRQGNIYPAAVSPLQPIFFDLAPKQTIKVTGTSLFKRDIIQTEPYREAFSAVVDTDIGYYDVFNNYHHQRYCQSMIMLVKGSIQVFDCRRQEDEHSAKGVPEE